MDSTGGALPGATVSATEEATGLVRTVVSNDVGLFRLGALNPGRYTLRIELSSFRPVTAFVNLNMEHMVGRTSLPDNPFV